MPYSKYRSVIITADLHSAYSCAPLLFVLSNVSTTRGHQYKLYKKRSTGVRALFFRERVINAWNKLPDDTDFKTLATCKHSINNTDFTGFLKRF